VDETQAGAFLDNQPRKVRSLQDSMMIPRKAPFSNWRTLAMGGLFLTANLSAAEDRVFEDSFETLDGWKVSAIRPAVLEKDGGVMMQGTLDRNNPLRRELAQPFRGAELFVRFQFRYDPPEDDGEFFVMWLDRLDGGDRAVHAENVQQVETSNPYQPPCLHVFP